MAVQENKYKLGQLISITNRKVSDKIQPKIKVGELYLVLKEEKPTKSGATCLSVINYDKAFDGYIAGMTNINPKLVMRCNADRLEWAKKSRAKVKEEFSKRHIAYLKQQEKIQDQQIRDKFTDNERLRIAYTPYMYAELAWYYANKVRELSIERRIDKFKKQSRMIKELRENFNYELKKKMTQQVLDAARNKVMAVLEEQYMNFFKFEMSVQNEINRQFVRIDNDDIKTYAYMAMLCYKSQRKTDIQNAKMINRRVGGFVEEIDSYKYMKELNDCMAAFLDGCKIENSLNIDISVKVFENNINSMKL